MCEGQRHCVGSRTRRHVRNNIPWVRTLATQARGLVDESLTLMLPPPAMGGKLASLFFARAHGGLELRLEDSDLLHYAHEKQVNSARSVLYTVCEIWATTAKMLQ